MRILKKYSLALTLNPALPAVPGVFVRKTTSILSFKNSKISLAALRTTLWATVSLLITSPLAFAEIGGTPNTRPTPFTAIYKETKGIMSVGTTKRTLQDKGNGNFMFESVTKPGGIAKLFTSGRVIERSY